MTTDAAEFAAPSNVPSPPPTGSVDRAEIFYGPRDRNDRGVTSGVQAVVQAVLSAIRAAGRVSATAITKAVEAPARILTQRVTAEAMVQPRPVWDSRSLAAGLAERSGTPVIGGAAAAAMAARVARRFGPLRFLARRTPLWILAAAVPALQASVSWGAHELALVTSRLVHRARAAGIEPDPERVRRAAVQLMAGVPVDPDLDGPHRLLVTRWLQRALRATMPLARGVATRDPGAVVAATDAVPPERLGPSPSHRLPSGRS